MNNVFDSWREFLSEAKDPKVGTGKKPKGSSRRLYTDENPDDTVSVKFRTVQDIKDTLSKSSFKSKSHARQSQIINLIHQRARAAYKNAKDPKVKARLKKAFEYAEKRKEASKKKTQRLKKENNFPFTEQQIAESTFLREFKQDVDSEELIWHMDREDRTVTVVESDGWEFQMDNELPRVMCEGDKIYIPKYTYHRIIKGRGDLVVEIEK
tara:strand:- start:959 stop:1588 length:630 start_codon:yes stop_codon:yes gene_type:complete